MLPHCTQGIFSSRGRKLLMADADGASKFSDLARLETALDDLNGKKVSLVHCRCYVYVTTVELLLMDTVSNADTTLLCTVPWVPAKCPYILYKIPL